MKFHYYLKKLVRPKPEYIAGPFPSALIHVILISLYYLWWSLACIVYYDCGLV